MCFSGPARDLCQAQRGPLRWMKEAQAPASPATVFAFPSCTSAGDPLGLELAGESVSSQKNPSCCGILRVVRLGLRVVTANRVEAKLLPVLYNHPGVWLHDENLSLWNCGLRGACGVAAAGGRLGRLWDGCGATVGRLWGCGAAAGLWGGCGAAAGWLRGGCALDTKNGGIRARRFRNSSKINWFISV